MAASAVNRAVPEVVRLGVRSAAKGPTLASLKALPLIGKHLLQRNMIKVAIPVVGIPLAVGLNVWSTGAVASTARQIYRDRALSDEKARRFVDCSVDDGFLVSVVWAAVRANRSTTPEEMLLLKDMVRFADETEGLDTARGDLGVDLDVESIFVRAAALRQEERDNLFEAALLAVTIDRKVHKQEREFLERLAAAINREWDPNCLRVMIRKTKV